jgi:hypothetical protein
MYVCLLCQFVYAMDWKKEQCEEKNSERPWMWYAYLCAACALHYAYMAYSPVGVGRMDRLGVDRGRRGVGSWN